MSTKKRTHDTFKRMRKKYIFKRPATLKVESHYTAETIAIICFDDRNQNRATFDLFMEHLGLKHWDEMSPAGGAKVFASPEKRGDQDFMLREIAKSIKLHHTKKVMLFTHAHCGAYEGIARFKGDEEKEFLFHISEHQKARAAVKKKFPKLRVKTYFIDQHGIVDMTNIR